jgi:hypothetical protein
MKKKLVRNGVFETNSSSSHSISIADSNKEFVLDTIYPNQNGIVFLSGGEFGWEWEKYNDAITKANYCLVDTEGNPERREMLFEVIKEHTGADLVEILSSDIGYIDHDSVGTTNTAFESKETLKNFIFNKNSWLFTGNDNGYPDPTFYNVPEFKGGRQILPVYKYELKIEGYEKTTKFLEKPDKEKLENALSSLLQGVHLTESGYFDDRTDIFSRITRTRTYEFNTWKKPINHKTKTAYFVKDGAWGVASNEWKSKFPNADWQKDNGYKYVSDREKELLDAKNSPYVKGVKFRIVKIEK